MNSDSNKTDSLSRTLREWRVEASLPPRFQERVWDRIAAAEKPRPSFWAGLTEWMDSIFSRPALAASYVAILIALGISTGVWQARERQGQAEMQWRAQYVQSVDPYFMPMK